MNKNQPSRIAKLDEQIRRVNSSTNTTFSLFSPLHNWLRAHSKLYYNWHLNQFASLVHTLVLLLVILSVAVAGVLLISAGIVAGFFTLLQ